MASSPRGQCTDDLRRRLSDLSAEILRTEAELAFLECERRLVLGENPLPPKIPQTPAEKVALFLDLFGTRRSVYPRRWENGKTGKSGYSPACDNNSFANRQSGVCRKPIVKCSECPHQRFPSLDERSVETHLRGEQTLGVYAIGADDTCRFLASDFDGDGWRDDVLAYREAAERVGVTVAIERSRSGNGAHGWIFFAEPVPAALARRLGAILVAKASALRPTLSLGAYDRLFPNQDRLPLGGFGNLIALPLAKAPRQNGNTLFVDPHMAAFEDQWSYLAGLPRLNRESLERMLARIAPVAPGPPSSRTGPGLDHIDDFVLQNDAMVLDLSQPRIRGGMIAGDVTVRLDAQIHVPRSLPTPVLAALKRLATFPNPVFHEKSYDCALQRLIRRDFILLASGMPTDSCYRGACWIEALPYWRWPVRPWPCRTRGILESVCHGNSKVSCGTVRRRRCARSSRRIKECFAPRRARERPLWVAL